MEQQQAVKPRTFYSRAAALQVCIGKASKHLDETGRVVYTGTKLAAFTPQTDGFGRLETDDPETIEVLEKHPDVIGHQEYVEAIMPPEIRVQQLKQENQRIITENNRLLQELANKGALPQQQKK